MSTKKKLRPKAKPKRFSSLPLDEQVQRVQSILEARVMPMLMSHGGGIEILDIQGNDVMIRYQGACHGCALATTGTLQFIEMVLQEEVDPNIRVVPL